MKKQACGKSVPGTTKSSIPRSVASLSPGSVDTLSVRELRRTLPQLVALLHERETRRPEWWPGGLPWTQHRLIAAVKTAAPSVMRKLAKKCCNFLTQQSSRAATVPVPVPALMQPRVLDWVNSHPLSHLCSQPVKCGVNSSPRKSGGVPYLDIYLCYQCNEEFSTKDTLQKHQVQCQGGALPLSIPSTPPVSEAPSPAAPTSTPEDPGSTGGASVAMSPSSRSSLSQSQFVTALDLVPIHRARKIRLACRRNTECETIDLEEPQTPVSPSTPRSHKMLITQLSRDVSSSSLGGTGSSGGLGGRRSSFLRLSLDKRPENLGNEKEEGKLSESDGESSDSNAEDADESKLRKKTLFSIDVSSLLGQRIIKHMTSEVHVPVISNLEDYCRTPIKDKYQDRLRIRQTTYPVTWKLTRKRQQHNYHLYKFTTVDKLEFKETTRTGLNKQSRRVRDSLKRCSVVVKRLSRQTLLKWTRASQVSLARRLLTQAKADLPQPSVFPEGPTFLLTDVDRVLGLKRKDGKPELARKLLASHCVSETANAELQSQKLTVYRCLLTDLYSSVTSDNGPHPGEATPVGRNREGTGRTKQRYPALLSILSGSATDYKDPIQGKAAGDACVDFEKPLKIDIPSPATGMLLPVEKSSSLDDSFSVKTVSSDEDNDKNMACCSLCAVRNKCRCQPKPAASAGVGPVTHSPALSSKVSTLSKASVSPPQLDPLSLTLQVSLSSHPSLSPPNLSPVSQLGEPSVARRVSTRISSLLLKTSSSPRLSSACPESAAGLSESGVFQCPSAPSPGQLLRCKRGDKAGAKEAASALVTAKRTHSCPVFSSSPSLVQPLLVSHTQKPRTRSSSKQNVSGEPCGLSLQQRPGHGRLDCSCGSTECAVGETHALTSSASMKETSKELACPRRESPVTPPMEHVQNTQDISGQGMQGSDKPTPNLKDKTKLLDSWSCTEGASSGHCKQEGKVCLGTNVDTSIEAEKESVADKLLTRSMQENRAGRLQKTEQRGAISDAKNLRNRKSYGAGSTTTKVLQKVKLMKKTPAKELKNTTTVGEVGDSNGSRALRNREKKHVDEELNKESVHSTSRHTKNASEMKERGPKVPSQVPDEQCKDGREASTEADTEDAKEFVSIRKLRSRESKDGSIRKKEISVPGEVADREQKTREIKSRETKAVKNVGKLKMKTSEEENGLDEDNMEVTNYGESISKDLQDTKEVGKKRIKLGSMRTTDHREWRDMKESVDSLVTEQDLGFSLGKHAHVNQTSEGENTTESDIQHGRLHKSAVNGNAQGTSAIETKTVQLRKTFSRRNVVKAQTEVSLQTDSKKKDSKRITRGGTVSCRNETETSCAKTSEQKMDTSADTVEPRGVKRTRQTSGESRTQNSGLDSSMSSTSPVNPFVISRAETRLFSSRIKEHAHRAWKLARKSPTAKGDKTRGLRSGNTFKMGTVSLGSLANHVEPERTQHFAHCSSFLLPDNRSTTLTVGEPLSTVVRHGAAGRMSPTRLHLSPKEMLSVLESTKASSSPSREKSRKACADRHPSGHGSSAKHATEAVTQNSGSLDSPAAVSPSQECPATRTIGSKPAAKNTSMPKCPVKTSCSQESAARNTSNQRTPCRSGGKLRSQEKGSSRQGPAPMLAKKHKTSVTRATGRRQGLSLSTVTQDPGGLCKKKHV